MSKMLLRVIYTRGNGAPHTKQECSHTAQVTSGWRSDLLFLSEFFTGPIMVQFCLVTAGIFCICCDHWFCTVICTSCRKNAIWLSWLNLHLLKKLFRSLFAIFGLHSCLTHLCELFAPFSDSGCTSNSLTC